MQIFIGKKISKENALCKCLSLKMLDSVIKVNKKCYPQTRLKQCKYEKIKRIIASMRILAQVHLMNLMMRPTGSPIVTLIMNLIAKINLSLLINLIRNLIMNLKILLRNLMINPKTLLRNLMMNLNILLGNLMINPKTLLKNLMMNLKILLRNLIINLKTLSKNLRVINDECDN